MRELKNGIKIIGVDTGYGNIKTCSTVTKSAINVYDTEPIFSGNVLEYDGKYYRFGEGHKPFIADKTTDEDFYMFTLMAIAKELGRAGIYSADIYLVESLPLTWVRVQRDKFKEYLMKNKTVKFKFNGREYNIKFIGCSVYPQAYPAVIERIGEFNGSNVLADIGNGTLNILYINNKKPIENKSWTEKLGVNQCVINIKNALMDKFGVKVDESIIDSFLRNGTVDTSEEYLDCMKAAAARYVRDIFSSLYAYEYNPKFMSLWIIGGGGCVIKHFGEYDKSRVTIIDDICANAKGLEYLAYMWFKRGTNI